MAAPAPRSHSRRGETCLRAEPEAPGGLDGPRDGPDRISRPRGPAEPVSAGRAAVGPPRPHPEDPVHPARGRTRRGAAAEAVHARDGGARVADDAGRRAEDAGRPREPGAPSRLDARREDALGPPAAHGGVLRVLDDAGPRRHRPEGARRALLRVPERRGGFRPRALRARRDAARARFRERGRPARRTSPSRSSTGNARARSRGRADTSASASATAGTR